MPNQWEKTQGFDSTEQKLGFIHWLQCLLMFVPLNIWELFLNCLVHICMCAIKCICWCPIVFWNSKMIWDRDDRKTQHKTAQYTYMGFVLRWEWVGDNVGHCWKAKWPKKFKGIYTSFEVPVLWCIVQETHRNEKTPAGVWVCLCGLYWRIVRAEISHSRQYTAPVSTLPRNGKLHMYNLIRVW